MSKEDYVGKRVLVVKEQESKEIKQHKAKTAEQNRVNKAAFEKHQRDEQRKEKLKRQLAEGGDNRACYGGVVTTCTAPGEEGTTAEDEKPAKKAKKKKKPKAALLSFEEED